MNFNYNQIFKIKIFISLNLLYLIILIKKPIKIALCTMGKQENLYVKEFIYYYKKLGVDTIFIYDDNDYKIEKFSDVINPLNLKYVKILNNTKYNIIHSQTKAFTSCYNNNKNKYDWFLMVDLDEFLIIKNNNLKNYLSKDIFKKCDFISFNWVIPTDNNLLHYDNRSLFIRFPGPFNLNRFVKTIIRGNINNLTYSVHSPLYSPIKNITCNSVGDKIYYKKLNYETLLPINIDNAYIMHFKYKSTEEYINKYKKGYYNLTGINLKKVLDAKILEYIRDNNITKEKKEYLEKELNINITKYKNNLFYLY